MTTEHNTQEPEPVAPFADRKVRTDNDFMVGATSTTVGPMAPPMCTTRDQAYRFAAWMVELAFVLPEEPDGGHSFEAIREAVRNT